MPFNVNIPGFSDGRSTRVGEVRFTGDINGQIKHLIKELETWEKKEFSNRRKYYIMRKAADQTIKSSMLAKVPVKYGVLKANIGYKVFRGILYLGVLKEKLVKAYTGEDIKMDVRYIGRWMEFGFRHIGWPKKGQKIKSAILRGKKITEIKGTGFISNSVSEQRNNYANIVISEMKKRVERIKIKQSKIRTGKGFSLISKAA